MKLWLEDDTELKSVFEVAWGMHTRGFYFCGGHIVFIPERGEEIRSIFPFLHYVSTNARDKELFEFLKRKYPEMLL